MKHLRIGVPLFHLPAKEKYTGDEPATVCAVFVEHIVSVLPHDEEHAAIIIAGGYSRVTPLSIEEVMTLIDEVDPAPPPAPKPP